MGNVRVLTRRDGAEVGRILDRRPIENVLVAARVQDGIERPRLGYELLGYCERGKLVSILSHSMSLHPINATDEALDAFAQRLEQRYIGSILGVRDEAIGLWQRLCDRSFTQWSSPREVRDHQLVMAISRDPDVAPDERLQVVGTSHLESYHAAAVAMHTEELGVAPLAPQGGYRDHVAGLMMRGQTMGVLVGSQVVFKADIVAAAGDVCQIGGVWLAPELRGHGWSKPWMAGVVALCRERYSTVSLYVNWFNKPAIACYRAVGFEQVGEYATVLY